MAERGASRSCGRVRFVFGRLSACLRLCRMPVRPTATRLAANLSAAGWLSAAAHLRPGACRIASAASLIAPGAAASRWQCKLGNRRAQRVRLILQRMRGGGGLLDERGVLLSDLIHFADRPVHLIDSRALFA